MDRLSEGAIQILDELHRERLDYYSEYVPLVEAIEKLARYEDDEAEGRLIILPCKVGDTVYKIVSANVPDDDYYMSYHKETFVTPVLFNPSHILAVGKTVFLTCEEAEAALKGGSNK